MIPEPSRSRVTHIRVETRATLRAVASMLKENDWNTQPTDVLEFTVRFTNLDMVKFKRMLGKELTLIVDCEYQEHTDINNVVIGGSP